MSRIRHLPRHNPEQYMGMIFAAAGLWMCVMSAIPDDIFFRFMFLPVGLLLFGMGIYGYAEFRDHSNWNEERKERQEQKRIDKEFKKIQRRGRKQFKNING